MLHTAVLVGLLSGAAADCYLQVPPGSNNRLDEGGGNRNNNNRLMDTQNNAKGGYGYGGDSNNPAEPLCYMAGSLLTTMWTSQHSCGSANNECQIVIQYMCNDAPSTPAGVPNQENGAGEGPLRDGTDNTTPDPNNPDADTGLHEPASFYNDCAARGRNLGLYIADQNVNQNAAATNTRQNPNGARSGQECPEERDYYPYWHPSPWKDVAVMTNNLAFASFYQANSQNVVGKNYCTNNAQNNQADCNAAGGTWETQPSFGLAAPEIVAAPFQRDNHLGDGPLGQEIAYNWTIPSGAGANGGDDATDCVARFRYNITTADTRVCSISSLATWEECTLGGGTWSAMYLDASYNDNVDGNNNQGNGNNAPALLEQNPDADMDGFLTDTGGTESLLELAVNTNQYGRTFQDRTHSFSICSRPASVGANQPIINLNVKGKRGNIVQTYPATEYDFTPVDLVVGSNDMVHVQWTGNDNTNNNGGNNGEGTNNEDRHNMVQLAQSGLDVPQAYSQQTMFDLSWEWNPEASTSQFGGSRDKDDLIRQAALSKQTDCLTEDEINGDQQRQNCQKLNAAAATVNLGLMMFKQGNYKYMSSRNMNFSNRAQKATLTVLEAPHQLLAKPVALEAVNVGTSSSNGMIKLTWQPPGSSAPIQGTDLNEYWGYQQQAATISDYKAFYSLDGGVEWIEAPASCGGTGVLECTFEELPAGTTTCFRVHAGSEGGWGEPSDPLCIQTNPSSSSEACASMLLQQAEGTWMSPGTIVAIVFGVLACLLLIAAFFWYLKRRTPPPPPPGVYDPKGMVPPAY